MLKRVLLSFCAVVPSKVRKSVVSHFVYRDMLTNEVQNDAKNLLNISFFI